MKRLLLYSIVLISSLSFTKISAQDDPGAYMTSISNAQQDMNSRYMAYMSAAAHGRRAKKIEKMRQQVLESIQNAKFKTADIAFYKGDKSLRQAGMDYIDFTYHVFNDDYAKIVNMEDIAEQSYDEMQAYILLQEKTEEKIHEANHRMDSAQSFFAAKYNVKLVEGHSDLGDKIAIAGKLNRYHNNVYLIFFKCNWEDGQHTDALNKGKLNDAEQARNALISYADEGLKALDNLKSFDNDASLYLACKQTLQAYKKMAETDMTKVTDYYLKKDNFDKVKKSFDAKPESSRTKADVDVYNKTVNDMNASLNTYNATNNKMNADHTNLINNWNKAESDFQDTHMPHYKS